MTSKADDRHRQERGRYRSMEADLRRLAALGCYSAHQRGARAQAGTRQLPSPETGQRSASLAHAPATAIHARPYCLSKISVSSYFLPSACVPLLLTVSVLPSADTTRCTLPTTLPPFLSVKSLVWASIALLVTLSASGLPVIGRSLPSYVMVTCMDISLPSAPTIF